ncbi:MAG: diaminopimelate dehydrogenase [Oscillospiraceae bacterium]|nr:diaminopimelate dehydrogenase [Oscillospiraceae bacterium]
MKKIVIIGMGNVGKAAAKAVLKSPDMELCGFIRRNAENVMEFADIPVAENVFDLPEKPDGAIICLPSRLAEPVETKLLEAGIYTADAFDIHEELPDMRLRIDKAAKRGGASAVIGAGWDPGLDSAIRTLMLAAMPDGTTYTNFGPGMSMGHSAAVKAIAGVKAAAAITLPLGSGKHRREIYIETDEKTDKKAVEHAILSDEYFEHDECSIIFTDSGLPFLNTAHGVNIERKNLSKGEDIQQMEFSMKSDNPTLTGQLLVSAMRAAFLQKPGAYFMPEIPPCEFCAGDWKEFL